MLDTCYAMLESIVTVTVLLVVLMFRALVEFVVTLAWQEVSRFRALLSVTTAIDMLYRALAHARTHAQTHTHVSGNRSLLHALQWHVARIRQLRRGASL
jgi:hypothetical protein